jgi:hypothetical protein
MQCYGDADVLGKLGFGETYNRSDIREFLGSEFVQLPEVFSNCQKLIDHSL